MSIMLKTMLIGLKLISLNMGYWKDVAYDMSRGMSRKTAEKVNAVLRSKDVTEEERQKAVQEGEFEIKLNTML